MAHTDRHGKSFPKLANTTILKAALGLETDYVPVWIMRQAGRYLSEFRQIRKEHSFFEICETPHLACEVTLLPFKEFNLDAAIIFSDILVIPQALGLVVEMTGEGPKLPDPLKIDDCLSKRLHKDVDISQRLKYVYEAITLTRHTLAGKCPLIGFSGAPWTLMCYMVEGKGSKTMSNAKKWLYQNPKSSHELLEVLTRKITDHLVEQAKAGAQMLQIFESNAEYLTLDLFKEFAYPYIMKICTNVKEQLIQMPSFDNVPIIVFAKGGHFAFDLLGQDSPKKVIDVLGLDWTMDPVKARSSTKLCLQGNLDPCAMYSDPELIRPMVEKMIQDYGTQKYIANLGHGIYPDARIETVKVFVDTVHEVSIKHNSLMNKNAGN